MTREEAIECLKYKNDISFGGQSEALKMAIQALEKEPKWIPIDEDHMPEEGKEVLFTVAKGAWNYEPAVLSGWFVSKYQEFEIDDEGRSVELEDVVAWMPFPEPYKEESEE